MSKAKHFKGCFSPKVSELKKAPDCEELDYSARLWATVKQRFLPEFKGRFIVHKPDEYADAEMYQVLQSMAVYATYAAWQMVRSGRVLIDPETSETKLNGDLPTASNNL